MTLIRRRWTLLGAAAVGASAWFLFVGASPGFDRYNDGCQDCHGDFTGPDSPRGTIFPGDDKHQMHRSSSWMDTECDLCHTDGDNRNPFIGSSNGTDNNPGVGCTGCHGRDYGGNIGNSGVGLRMHHTINGIQSCANCHPNDPDPLPENIMPTYYGTADTKADDPCNAEPDFLENWSLEDPIIGLDNDGDNDYDGADGDCAACDLPGDVDGDGDVDFQDLLALLADWGCTGEPGECAGDVDNDGDTDFQDLLALLAQWGETCP